MIGTIVDVVRRDPGTALVADAAAGTRTLQVANTSAFQGPGRLVVDDQDVAYTSATDGTITLPAGLPAAAIESAPVYPLDVRGLTLVVWYVRLVVDGEDEPVSARIPSPLVIYFSEGDELAGSTVEVTLVDGERRVVAQPDRAPVVNSDYISTPIASAVYAVTVDQPDGSWNTIFNVITTDQVDFTYSGGRWFPEVEGYYLILFGATFDGNSNGARQIRITIYDVDGVPDPLRAPSVNGVAGVRTALETTATVRLAVGESVAFEVRQTSGGVLALRGRDGGDASVRPTDYTILKVAP